MSLEPQIRELLAGRSYGHLATIVPDGSPPSVPVRVGLDRERVVFFVDHERAGHGELPFTH